jgi:hypothetical protein
MLLKIKLTFFQSMVKIGSPPTGDEKLKEIQEEDNEIVVISSRHLPLPREPLGTFKSSLNVMKRCPWVTKTRPPTRMQPLLLAKLKMHDHARRETAR